MVAGLPTYRGASAGSAFPGRTGQTRFRGAEDAAGGREGFRTGSLCGREPDLYVGTGRAGKPLEDQTRERRRA